jgi:hypothetical protein
MDIVGLAFLYLALCLVAGIAGRNRRMGFWGFLFSSICFTPNITLLFLYCAVPRKV